MDPISFSLEIELATLLVSLVGAIAARMHNRDQKAVYQQRERHHQENTTAEEHRHRERMTALRNRG